MARVPGASQAVEVVGDDVVDKPSTVSNGCKNVAVENLVGGDL
jgi:hypothetical protein